MGSLVLELQKEVLRKDCDLVNVLRKAHLIAVKLGLMDFNKWLSCELNGYVGDDVIPGYREVRGVLKAYNPYHGWLNVMVEKQIETAICCSKIPNSISEIKTLFEKSDNGIIRELPGELQIRLNLLSHNHFPTQFRIDLPVSALGDILEKVKNMVLEWTIKLEGEGIVGEEMQFNSTEKEAARKLSQEVNHYYGNVNVINAPMKYSSIVAGNNNSMVFTYEKASEIMSEIETALKRENISADDMESAKEILREIREKISQQKKPNVIRSTIIGLKDFLIGIGASATVAVVQNRMPGWF